MTKISGLVSSKDISSALEFEFDRDEHEIIVLEDLVSLSQHERWVSIFFELIIQNHEKYQSGPNIFGFEIQLTVVAR